MGLSLRRSVSLSPKSPCRFVAPSTGLLVVLFLFLSYFLLGIGYWVLDIGYWVFVIGYWLLAPPNIPPCCPDGADLQSAPFNFGFVICIGSDLICTSSFYIGDLHNLISQPSLITLSYSFNKPAGADLPSKGWQVCQRRINHLHFLAEYL